MPTKRRHTHHWKTLTHEVVRGGVRHLGVGVHFKGRRVLHLGQGFAGNPNMVPIK